VIGAVGSVADYDLPGDLRERYGPWALVAGGSEGVGESFARMLASRGLNLVLLARRSGPLEALAASIRESHAVEVRTLPVDLTSADMMDQVAAKTADIEVGLLIYNAGSNVTYNRFPDWRVEELDFLLGLNCYAPVHLAHHFSRGMVERGRGGIMLLSSLAAFAGSAWMSLYPATKAFDHILAEGLWHDLKPSGVDVMCLVLGATKTPSHAQMDFDAMAPGFAMSCDEVALEGLNYLGRGPLWVAGEQNRARLPEGMIDSRAEAIEQMSAATAAIRGLDHLPAK
jgi:short-subunit dehydrogenase